MPTVSADDIVGFAPGTRGTTVSPDDIVGFAKAPTYFPQTVSPDDVQPTAQEQSTLEAPEGSPQREDINRGVAGSLFSPPGVFARDPTLSELINASMPRSVQEAQMRERQIPMAPPLPEQGQFEQGGLLPYVAGAVQTAENVVPHSWEQAREMIKPPMGGVDLQKEEELGKAWRGEYGPMEQSAAITGTALQALPLVHLPFARSPFQADVDLVNQLKELRKTPEPPPTQSMGPGTIAGDVSRALERRFELQQTPPPDIAPAPTIEETLAQSIRKAPQMPVDPEVTQSLAQRILAQRTLTPEVLRAFREQGEPLPPPEVAREPVGPLSETAVEKAMRTTSQSPLQSAIDIVRGQETPSVNLPDIPSVTKPPTPVEQPVLSDMPRRAQSESLRFTPETAPPGTDLKPVALRGPNGQTPAADVAAQAARTETPPLLVSPETPVAPGSVPVAEPVATTPQLEVPAGDERYAGVEPTAGPELPSAQLPESGFDTERAQDIYGKDAVLITKGKSAKAWKAIGQADKRNPYDVLEQSRARGIATPEDSAALRAEHQRLLERARQQYGTPEYNDLAQNAVDFLNASKEVAHGPAADILRGLQEADTPTYMSPADYDNILRERQMQATPDESATFKKVADERTRTDTEARDAAANGQEAIRKYKPNEVVPFDEAANYVKEEIKKLTEPCVL